MGVLPASARTGGAGRGDFDGDVGRETPDGGSTELLSGDAGRAKADRAGELFMWLSNAEALNPGEKARVPTGDSGARGSGGMFCGR